MMRIVAFLCLMCVAGSVYAIDRLACMSISDQCDQGQAYEATAAQLAYQKENGLTAPTAIWDCNSSNSYGFRTNGQNDCNGQRFYVSGNNCSTRPVSTSGWSYGGNGASCSGGCAYGPATSAQTMTVGGRTYFSLVGAKPTGAVCTYGDGSGQPVSSDDCVQSGSLTQCVKPDGRHCVTASTGKQFCWKPSESGTKTSGNEAMTKAPADVQIKDPTSKPANGGEWKSGPSASGSVGSQQFNINTFTSTYGPEGNGGGAEGEGEGEEDGDKPTAATGAGCDQGSFQCSDMSSVECNQLIQTWYLRCKGVDLNGGANCDAPPSCTGNASDCYIGRMLWNYRCDGKDEAAAGQPTSGFDGDVAAEGDGKDLPDVSKIGTGDTADASLSMWQEKNINAELDKLNAGGFLNGSDQCPQLPPFTVGTSSFTLSMAPICSILRNVGIMVLALSYWLAIRILAKSR